MEEICYHELHSVAREFKTNNLDDDLRLIEPKLTMTAHLEEESLSLHRLKDDTKLEEKECQHYKIKDRLFHTYSFQSLNTSLDKDDINKDTDQKRFAFSKENKNMKSSKIVNKGSASSRRKDRQSLATNDGEHAGNSSSIYADNLSDETALAFKIQDQNDRAKDLFLKLQSIGKLSTTVDHANTFDLHSEGTWGEKFTTNLSSLESKIISQKEMCDYTSYTPPTMDNKSKSIQSTNNALNVPESQFHETENTISPVEEGYEETLKENHEARSIVERRLSVPKEVYKSELIEKLMMMPVASERFTISHGVGGKSIKDETIQKKEPQIVQNEINYAYKIHQNAEMQSNIEHEKEKMLLKRGMVGKRKSTILKNVAVVIEGGKADGVQKCVQEDAFMSSCCSLPGLPDVAPSRHPIHRESKNPQNKYSYPFQECEHRKLAEKEDRKKQFRFKIADANKMLQEARLAAQERTAAIRFNDPLKKQTELKHNKTFLNKTMCKPATPSLVVRRSSSSLGSEMFKDVSLSASIEGVNIEEERKARVDPDRAKVKQIQTKMKLQKKPSTKIPVKKSTGSQARKLRSVIGKHKEKLERYEVDKMTSEVRSLNMIDYADKLCYALTCKEEYEVKLPQELDHERRVANQPAKKRIEKPTKNRIKIESEKMEVKERFRQEKRKREALEIAKRQINAVKRQERNLKLKESIKYNMLATNTSRAFTYSYLPKLKNPSAKVQKNYIDILKKAKAK